MGSAPERQTVMKTKTHRATASKDAKAVTLGALLGLLIPVGIVVTAKLYPSILRNWMGWLWPSWVLVLIFGFPAPVADMRLIWAVSIGINVCLYATLLWFATILFDTWKRL
jgi:hypothetical protein